MTRPLTEVHCDGPLPELRAAWEANKVGPPPLCEHGYFVEHWYYVDPKDAIIDALEAKCDRLKAALEKIRLTADGFTGKAPKLIKATATEALNPPAVSSEQG